MMASKNQAAANCLQHF